MLPLSVSLTPSTRLVLSICPLMLPPSIHPSTPPVYYYFPTSDSYLHHSELMTAIALYWIGLAYNRYLLLTLQLFSLANGKQHIVAIQ